MMLSTIRKSLQQSFQIKRCLHRFTCEPLTENRYEEALDHIRETTYRDISLYKAAGLVEASKARAELDNVYLKSMKEGISKIFLSEGKLAGIMINGILTPDAVSDAVANIKKSTNERYRKFDYMFMMLLQEIDIFARFGINRAVECHIVSISREYRGTGLLKIVVDDLVQTARDLDYPMVVAEVTNTPLWNWLALHDWILLRELQISDYIDEATGKSLYKVDPPNNILRICAQIVDNSLHRFTYEPITENRYEEVLVHLRDTTYHDIPFYKAAGLVGAGRAPEELDNYFLQSMEEGISMIALKEGKLAGVVINGILTPDVVSDAVVNMNKLHKESYKKVYCMFLRLMLELNIFERFGVNRIMEWRLVSTKREYRQSGLGKTLIGRLNQMARDLYCPMIVADVTNKFLWNSRVLDDWILLRKMPYSDYIDEATGKSLYKVDPPHDILYLCARIIDNRCKSKDPLPLPNSKIYYPIKID